MITEIGTTPEDLRYKRHTELFERIKQIPGVVDVIAWEEIDIIIFDAPPGEIDERGQLLYLQGKAEDILGHLSGLGINITHIGFSYTWRQDPIRKKWWEEGFSSLSVKEIWADVLARHFSTVIWKIFQPVLTALAPSRYVRYFESTRTRLAKFGLVLGDLVEGQRFQIITASPSEYVLIVEKDGSFRVESWSNQTLVGKKLYYFDTKWSLRGVPPNVTNEVTLMKKL